MVCVYKKKEQIESVLNGKDSVYYNDFRTAILKYSNLCAALGSSYRVAFVTGEFFPYARRKKNTLD